MPTWGPMSPPFLLGSGASSGRWYTCSRQASAVSNYLRSSASSSDLSWRPTLSSSTLSWPGCNAMQLSGCSNRCWSSASDSRCRTPGQGSSLALTPSRKGVNEQSGSLSRMPWTTPGSPLAGSVYVRMSIMTSGTAGLTGKQRQRHRGPSRAPSSTCNEWPTLPNVPNRPWTCWLMIWMLCNLWWSLAYLSWIIIYVNTSLYVLTALHSVLCIFIYIYLTTTWGIHNLSLTSHGAS